MAGTGGLLTAEEKEKVQKWIDDKSKHPAACPVCGDERWIIADHLITPEPVSGGRLLYGGPAYPQFMLISVGCGYTRYFNAVISGIVVSEPPSDKQAERGS
jgi:hypothetical protein